MLQVESLRKKWNVRFCGVGGGVDSWFISDGVDTVLDDGCQGVVLGDEFRGDVQAVVYASTGVSAKVDDGRCCTLGFLERFEEFSIGAGGEGCRVREFGDGDDRNVVG